MFFSRVHKILALLLVHVTCDTQFVYTAESHCYTAATAVVSALSRVRLLCWSAVPLSFQANTTTGFNYVRYTRQTSGDYKDTSVFLTLPLTMLKSEGRRRHCAPKPRGTGVRNPTIATGAVATRRAVLPETCIVRAVTAVTAGRSEGDVGVIGMYQVQSLFTVKVACSGEL